MPRYFFHMRSKDGWIVDPEGSELADLSAAHAEAIKDARDAMSRAILRGRNLSSDGVVEICDEQNRVILRVLFAEAIVSDKQ